MRAAKSTGNVVAPRVVGIALGLFVATLGSNAVAEPEQKDSPNTEALLAEGRELDEAGDYKAACAKFNEAIAAAPNSVTTMLALGACNEHLRKYATALMWFRRARLFSKDHGLTSSEQKASGRAEALESHVPVVKITWGRTRPSGVKVAIDDYPVPPTDFKHVELDPGHHTLDVLAPELEPFHKEIDLEDAEVRTIVVELGAKDGSSRDDRDQPKSSSSNARRRTASLMMVGGGAALVAGGVIAFYARSKYNECVVDGRALPMCLGGQNGYSAANHYRSLARWGATPLVLGGAALVGVGAYLYFTAPVDSGRGVTWAPIVGESELGIAALGRF